MKNKQVSLGVALFAVVLGIIALVLVFTMNKSGQVTDNDNKIKALEAEVAEFKGKLDAIELQNGFSVDNAVNKDGYQAVFLANDQTYFGKLSDSEPGQVKLENIYYLQDDDGFSLAKLGNELHGPEDVMYISRDKLNFWENLKDDSEVVTAIREYEENL